MHKKMICVHGLIVAAAIFVLAVSSGCRGKNPVAIDGEGVAGNIEGAELVVALEGVKYLHPTPLQEPFNSSSGALHSLGDIDGDGRTDFVVAASRQGSGSTVDRGWIEAYSGKDGARLWQVGGKSDAEAKAEGDENGIQLADTVLVGDVNGDGTPDVYCREAYYKRSVLLISGRDGERIGRFPIERNDDWRRPLYADDLDGDGVPEIVIRARNGSSAGLRAVSARDFAVVSEKFDFWPEAEGRQEWLLPRLDDVNRDGAADHLLRRGLRQSNTDPVYTFEFALVSGKDFSIIKKFETPRPRVGGKNHYAVGGDLNGDGAADLLMTSSTGAGESNDSSFLCAISGADGKVLWQILGTDLEGGPQAFAVDAKSGKKTDLHPDVEFEAPVLSTPDIDGDSVRDVATVAHVPKAAGSGKGVLVFSGKSGKQLVTLTVSKNTGTLGDALVLLDKAGSDSKPAIAVAGSGRAGSFVAILTLPSAR
ncbi:MAG: VCBS repeat-containing protein [Planctomycetaceae bacterium]